MMNNVHLTPVTYRDQPALAELFAKARLAEDEALIPGYITQAMAEGYFDKAITKFLAGHYEPSCMMKAQEGCQLVGFFMVGRADDYPEIRTNLPAAICGELHWLYPDPTKKRQGIGRQLFARAATELCRLGYNGMVINALRDKPGTQAFYAAMGAHVMAERIEYNTRNGITFVVPCRLLGMNVEPVMAASRCHAPIPFIPSYSVA